MTTSNGVGVVLSLHHHASPTTDCALYWLRHQQKRYAQKNCRVSFFSTKSSRLALAPTDSYFPEFSAILASIQKFLSNTSTARSRSPTGHFGGCLRRLPNHSMLEGFGKRPHAPAFFVDRVISAAKTEAQPIPFPPPRKRLMSGGQAPLAKWLNRPARDQSPHWTAEEMSLLRVLAVQVRVLTVEQAIRCGIASASETENALSKLSSAGLLEEHIIEIHPFLSLAEPIFSWRPGLPKPPTPRFEKLATELQARWAKDIQAVTVFTASKEAAHMFGSRAGGVGRDDEHTHDVHVTEVFLRYLNNDDSIRRTWYGELALDKLGFKMKHMKDPDAFLLDSEFKATRVVEFAGRYTAKHLEDLHKHCAGGGFEKAHEAGIAELTVYREAGTPYELW